MNEEEMLIDSDDEEDIFVIAATSIFMRRDLNRNYGFCDVIVPTYSIDESHFRMTRGTLDILCREVAAKGIILQGNRFGRSPIPVQCQVLAFVWFMSNSEVDAPWSELSGSNTNTDTSSLSPFCLQFDYRGPGTRKDYRGDAIGTRETSRDVPTGKTGLPSEQFHFFWEFSSRANRKTFFI